MSIPESRAASGLTEIAQRRAVARPRQKKIKNAADDHGEQQREYAVDQRGGQNMDWNRQVRKLCNEPPKVSSIRPWMTNRMPNVPRMLSTSNMPWFGAGPAALARSGSSQLAANEAGTTASSPMDRVHRHAAVRGRARQTPRRRDTRRTTEFMMRAMPYWRVSPNAMSAYIPPSTSPERTMSSARVMRSAFAVIPDAIQIGDSRFGWRSEIRVTSADPLPGFRGARAKARAPE